MVNFNTWVYDVETTGVNIEEDRIVEISWLLLDRNFERINADTQLINPQRDIPIEVVNIHGIKNAMVIDQPTFKDYFDNFIGPILNEYDPMIGGYNTKKFGDEIVQAELKRVGYDLPITEFHSLDVFALYKQLNPRDLMTISLEYLGEEEIEKTKLWFTNNREPRNGVEGFHTAEFDTIITAMTLRKMFIEHEEILPKDAEELNDFIHRKNPNDIDIDGKFQWKNGKAVITFGKHAGTPLQKLAVHERGYLSWIIKKSFPTEVKKIAEDALNGVFPEPPEELE